MDSVPYAFCEAVCGVLHKFGLNLMSEGRASKYAIWNRAAKRTREERLDVEIYIDFRSNTWKYKITICEEGQIIGRMLSFQDFRKLNRQHVHVTEVWIGSQSVFRNRISTLGEFIRRQKLQRTKSVCQSGHSTLNEIAEIIKFTAPCVNSSLLAISEKCSIPEDDRFRLLSFYRNATFGEITFDYHNRASEQFLIAQMQTSALKYLSIEREGWTEDLRSAIEEFALNKDFRSINVLSPSLVFGRAFFDALVQKPFYWNRSTFEARFSFDAQQLTSGFQEICLLSKCDGFLRMTFQSRSNSVNVVSWPTPPPQRRGRSRKPVAPKDARSAAANKEARVPAAPKSRGRPRKSEVLLVIEEVVSPAPKKRGRPRKIVVEENAVEGAESQLSPSPSSELASQDENADPEIPAQPSVDRGSSRRPKPSTEEVAKRAAAYRSKLRCNNNRNETGRRRQAERKLN